MCDFLAIKEGPMTLSKRGFVSESLSQEELSYLHSRLIESRGAIVKMTTLAGCGHPGGSLSSLEIYTLLWLFSNVDPKNPLMEGRDRIVVSHGHTSPGVYAALADAGFIERRESVVRFRQAGSAFPGHIEQCVPGVEWDTGNLGQGLSASLGFALANRLCGRKGKIFCVMGDGEQQKGQIAEARRTAVKYKVPLVAVIDYNELQICGDIHKVMYQPLKEEWGADGWQVLEVDGHDLQALYQALRTAYFSEKPVVIIAKTIMGHGISFMENKAKYHGSALSLDECRAALKELGLPDDLDELAAERKSTPPRPGVRPKRREIKLVPGTPILYTEKTDNRSAWGNALANLAAANKDLPGSTPLAALDCDLKGSVKLADFEKVLPDNFFQIGIQEHNAAVVAGAMTKEGVVAFWADFGAFGVDETYNQHRLSAMNEAFPKIICTHCGLDVGEDGRTHQCVDYLGLFKNLLGFEVIVPADPNQTDRAVRYLALTNKPTLLVMGRSKVEIIKGEDGAPYFGQDYVFEYGKSDLLRSSKNPKAALLVCGTPSANAVAAFDLLKEKGIEVSVYNIASPLSLDAATIQAAAATGLIVTIEDHLVVSGLGTSVAEKLVALGLQSKLVKIGVTAYGGSATPKELYAEFGLDAASIAKTVQENLR